MPVCPITKKEAILEFTYSPEDLHKLYSEELNVDISDQIPSGTQVGLYRCPETDFAFFLPESVAGNGAFYSELVKKKYSYYTPWKWEHQNAHDYLDQAFGIQSEFSLLEIGCAEGLFLQRTKKIFPNCYVHGLEINEDAISEAKKLGDIISYGFIQDYKEIWKGKFDVVVAFQVLEHISEIRSFIEAAIDVLKPGGKLIFGVPNNDSYIFKYDKFHTLNLPPHHMGWWNKRSLESIEGHFNVRVIKTITEPADMNNLGIYFDVWLKNHIPRFRKILYPLFRFPVKLVLRLFPPASGLTITGIFEKRSS